MNKYFRESKTVSYLVSNQQKVFFLLIILLYGVVLLSHSQQPVLLGEESYHYVSIVNEYIENVPTFILAVIPLLIQLGILTLFYHITNRIKLSKTFTFFFVLFVVLSPFFLYSLTSISTYAIFTLLFLLGVVIEKNKGGWFAIIPFALTTFIDHFSTILVLLYLFVGSSKNIRKKVFLFFIFLLFFVNLFFLNVPLTQGPFHVTDYVGDIIADLGNIGVISFFLIILAVIGIGLTWRNKKLYTTYFVLPFAILAFVLNTNTSFILSLVLISFATTAFLTIFRQKWVYPDLKKIVALIFFLGLIFSSLSFLSQIPLQNPHNSHVESLEWLEEYTPTNAIIFSTPENGVFIKAIADRPPFITSSTNDIEILSIYNQSMNAGSTSEFFPHFEEKRILYLYINENSKDLFYRNRGFHVFLNDERFKLVHSSENTEVWMFKDGHNSN